MRSVTTPAALALTGPPMIATTGTGPVLVIATPVPSLQDVCRWGKSSEIGPNELVIATSAVAMLPWLLYVPAPERKQATLPLWPSSCSVQVVEVIVKVVVPGITRAVNDTEPNSEPYDSAGVEPADAAKSNPTSNAGAATTA